jgi:hypothetical protein
VLGSVWIVRSDGFYFIDELARFLYSRFVLQSLSVTVETWHRPIPLWLFALPAQFGHTVTMFFAFALYLILLLFTYKIAVLKGLKHAEWIVLLVGLQPILFDVSYACLNEVPAALVLVLSYWYHVKGKHGASMTIASLAIMCRPEAYLFAGIMFLVYLREREWKVLPLVFIGPLLWIASTTIISGDVMTFFTEWSKYSSLKKNVPGVSVFFYLENLPGIFGIVQVALFTAGVIMIARAKRSADFIIIYAAIATTIILNTMTGAEVFHWTGSIADVRYLTVVGPFFGIVSLYGISFFLEHFHSRNVRTAISACLFAAIVFNCTLATHPRRWENYDKVVIDMTHAAQHEYPGVTVLSNNPIVQYIMDAAPTGGESYAPFNKKMLLAHPVCLILYDDPTANSFYHRSNVTKLQLLRDPAVVISDQYRYANTEYLLLYRHSHEDLAKR